MIIRVPYELVVLLLGERLAPYFNDICNTLCFIGLFFFLLRPRKTQNTVKKEVDTRPIYIDEDENGRYIYTGTEAQREEPPIKEEYFGQYDRYSDLTDEELRLAMQIRVERTEPTYEEWRAARLAEQEEKKHQDE